MRYGYLRRSIYVDQLERWFSYFPREQFLILRSEDLFTQPEVVYQAVLEFLELRRWALDAYEKVNAINVPDIDPMLREGLAEFFRRPNERLYELLGADFGWS